MMCFPNDDDDGEGGAFSFTSTEGKQHGRRYRKDEMFTIGFSPIISSGVFKES